MRTPPIPRGLPLHLRAASKLTAPPHERIIEQAPLLEIRQESGDRLVVDYVIVQIGFLSAKETFRRLDLRLNDDGSIAIDLPQKALVWEDNDGAVWISYNDPKFLKLRHGTEGCDQVFDKVSMALGKFVGMAAAE